MEGSAKLSLICHFLLLSFLSSSHLEVVKICSGQDDQITSVRCIASERDALVSFKNGLTDPSGRLSSWVGEECCKWEGVECNNRTRHVSKLNLRNPYHSLDVGLGDDDPTAAYKRSCVGGKINSSLAKLKFLSYLDLSMNNFEGILIPDFLGEISNLRCLNLSFASFSGEVPSNLGQLSRLQYLDLYADSYLGVSSGELRAESLNWLSGLSSLTHLNLGYVKLNGVGETWLEKVNLLPSLVELNLHWCELQGLPLSLPFSINFTSLSVLDLSENSFNSPIPTWLFNLTSLRKLHLTWNFLQGPIPQDVTNLKLLEDLDLSDNLSLEGHIPGFLGNLSNLKRLDLSANEFTGHIHEFLNGLSDSSSNGTRLLSLDLSSNSLVGDLPESLGNLRNLQILILSGNAFSGSIPASIGRLSFLKVLDLSYNNMNGTIPKSFGQLSRLVDANLLMNSWEGVLTESHLMNLKGLKSLRITTESTKSLVYDVPVEWLPPFRLDYIQLENCRVGPFPLWLQVQSELTFVTLRNAGISGTIPDQWLSNLSSRIIRLDLSKNQIEGKLQPHQLAFPHLQAIDLSSNRFDGPLPHWSINVTELFLEANSFSGPIPENLAQLMPWLQKLHLSWNHLSGGIPPSLCELQSLQVLSLRSNHFSGELPNCWHTFALWGFDVTDNNLSGVIPNSLGSLPSLSVLMLRKNNLHGEIPSSLQNCSGLTTIDLSMNNFTGNLPSWLGGRVLDSLFMLRLESNNFAGDIPQELCSLRNLHGLDLSNNDFSGVIPKCFDNLTALVFSNSSEVFENLLYVVLRGRDPTYGSILADVNSINLSGNDLKGGIPDEITSIHGLHKLNLSRNHLSGKIPDKIGNLEGLDTLDLSHNRLSGTIPQSLSHVIALKHLNLSYNNLEGKIPQLPQFNDASIFAGNSLLCGDPLPTKCKTTT